MAERIPAADIRPGMVVELTIKARVTEIEQSWHEPMQVRLLDGTMTLPLRHQVALLPDTEVTVHER